LRHLDIILLQQFYSETDTEVIAQLVAHLYQGDILLAVQEALTWLQGTWGFAVVHQLHPDQIVVASKDSPVTVGIDLLGGQAFIASDRKAFGQQALTVVRLQNNDCALVKATGITLWREGKLHTPQAVDWQGIPTDDLGHKAGYAHFMWKEIMDQPQSIMQGLEGRFEACARHVLLSELETLKEQLLGVKRLVFLGCGSSYHAGQIGAALCEEMLQLPAQAEVASEFRYRTPLIEGETLAICISQSGETRDVIAACQEAQRLGALVVALCNVNHSTLEHLACATVSVRAGAEVSVCATKSFTSQVVTIVLLLLHLATVKGIRSARMDQLMQGLQGLTLAVETVLAQAPAVAACAGEARRFSRFFFLGRCYMAMACAEAALKLREVGYADVYALPSGEMKHGAIALVDSSTLVIGFCGHAHVRKQMYSNLMEVQARGASVVLCSPEDEEMRSELWWGRFVFPANDDVLDPIMYVIFGQMFAYHYALQSGFLIDCPRNLAKSVTVE